MFTVRVIKKVFPERLWSLHPWRDSKFRWPLSWAPFTRWLCSEKGFGLGNFQRILPTSLVLWFDTFISCHCPLDAWILCKELFYMTAAATWASHYLLLIHIASQDRSHMNRWSFFVWKAEKKSSPNPTSLINKKLIRIEAVLIHFDAYKINQSFMSGKFYFVSHVCTYKLKGELKKK